MNQTFTHVTLTKLSQRSLRENVIESNINKLLESVYSKSAENAGWTVGVGLRWSKEESTDADAEYVYSIDLSIMFKHEREPESTELDNILRKIASRCSQPQFGRWTLTEVDGEKYQPHNSAEGESEEADFGYAPVAMPEDFDSYFSHLYGLDAQVTLVRRAVELAMLTNWTERKNCVLYGPPGCGKTDVSLSLKSALGEEAVWSLDGTAMTGAGAIKELTEREVLPRVIVIEEIEKANEDALRFLLGLLDQRGEVRKLTARGAVQRDTKCFAVVTVNDMKKFQQLLAGALASRCPNKIRFNRPSREVLTAILERDITRMGGDFAWIEPALDFAESHNIADVRTVQSICLCGREMLLTGEYQEMLEATMPETEGE